MNAVAIPDLPSFPVEEQALPEYLAHSIEQSVGQFESKFGMLLSWARSQGWVDEYRAELIRIARIAISRP